MNRKRTSLLAAILIIAMMFTIVPVSVSAGDMEPGAVPPVAEEVQPVAELPAAEQPAPAEAPAPEVPAPEAPVPEPAPAPEVDPILYNVVYKWNGNIQRHDGLPVGSAFPAPPDMSGVAGFKHWYVATDVTQAKFLFENNPVVTTNLELLALIEPVTMRSMGGEGNPEIEALPGAETEALLGGEGTDTMAASGTLIEAEDASDYHLITYDLDGGTGTRPQDTTAYPKGSGIFVLGSDATKAVDGVTKGFSGWVDQHGVEYKFGSTLDTGAREYGRSIVLTAQYEHVSFIKVTWKYSDEIYETELYPIEKGQVTIISPSRYVFAQYGILVTQWTKIAGPNSLPGTLNESKEANSSVKTGDPDIIYEVKKSQQGAVTVRDHIVTFNAVGLDEDGNPVAGYFETANNTTMTYPVPVGSTWADSNIGDTGPIPDAPAGYEFVRWVPDGEYGFPYVGAINDNLLYIAEYKPLAEEPITHTVTFEAGENGALSGNTPAIVADGEYLAKSQIPTPVPATGYKFAGWQVKGGDETLIQDLTTIEINNDTTFIAVFEVQTFTVTFELDGGSFPTESGMQTEYTVDYGTVWGEQFPSIPDPTPPTGKVFTGWEPELPSSNTQITADQTFTATYEEYAITGEITITLADISKTYDGKPFSDDDGLGNVSSIDTFGLSSNKDEETSFTAAFGTLSFEYPDNVINVGDTGQYTIASNVNLTINGITKTIAEWEEEITIHWQGGACEIIPIIVPVTIALDSPTPSSKSSTEEIKVKITVNKTLFVGDDTLETVIPGYNPDDPTGFYEVSGTPSNDPNVAGNYNPGTYEYSLIESKFNDPNNPKNYLFTFSGSVRLIIANEGTINYNPNHPTETLTIEDYNTYAENSPATILFAYDGLDLSEPIAGWKFVKWVRVDDESTVYEIRDGSDQTHEFTDKDAENGVVLRGVWEVDEASITVTGGTYVYNGTARSIEVKGLLDSDTVTFTDDYAGKSGDPDYKPGDSQTQIPPQFVDVTGNTVKITVTIQRGNAEPITKVAYLEITQAPLTITAKSYTIASGAPAPTPYELKYSDTVAARDKDAFDKLSPSCNYDAGATQQSETQTTHDIIIEPTDFQPKNYAIKLVNGILTVKPGLTVTYNANGGDANQVPDKHFAIGDEHGASTATVAGGPNPTREGFIFKGWATVPENAKTLDEDILKGEETFTITKDTILYAVWALDEDVIDEWLEDAVNTVFDGDEHPPKFTPPENIGKITYNDEDDMPAYRDVGDSGDLTVVIETADGHTITLKANINITKRLIIVGTEDATVPYSAKEQSTSQKGEDFSAGANSGLVNDEYRIDAQATAKGKNAGTYVQEFGNIAIMNGDINETDNYAITEAPGDFIITPVDVLITVDDKSKTTDEEDPDFTGTPAGLLGTDTLANLTYVREDDTVSIYQAGEYKITATFDENPNYTVTIEKGTLTVTDEGGGNPGGGGGGGGGGGEDPGNGGPLNPDPKDPEPDPETPNPVEPNPSDPTPQDPNPNPNEPNPGDPVGPPPGEDPQPQNPTEPTPAPTDPTDPVDPIDPVDPVDPADPVDPPVDPVTPIDPVPAPADPATPVVTDPAPAPAPITPVAAPAPAAAAPAAAAALAPAPADDAAAPADDDDDDPAPVLTTTPTEDPADPTQQIGEGEVPLAGLEPEQATGAWALLNLILAIFTLLLGVILFIGIFSRRKRKEYETLNETTNEQETEETKGKTGMIWRILGILMGIASPIVFLLTENINNPMIFVDNWTVLMVVLLVVQVIFMVILNRARQPKDEEDQHNTPAQA